MSSTNSKDLHIAEIPYDNGSIKFRYSRRINEEGTKWIREGLFTAFHENGNIASEGNYANDFEEGLWKDFHANGQIAAEGKYSEGKEEGTWKFWNEDGSEEQHVQYINGQEVT